MRLRDCSKIKVKPRETKNFSFSKDPLPSPLKTKEIGNFGFNFEAKISENLSFSGKFWPSAPPSPKTKIFSFSWLQLYFAMLPKRGIESPQNG